VAIFHSLVVCKILASVVPSRFIPSHFSLEGKLVAACRPVSELRSKNARFALVPPPPQTNLRAEPERSDCRPSWLSEYCLQPSSTFATFSQLQFSDIIPQTIYFFKLVDGTQEATRPSPPVLNNHMQPTPPTRQQPFHSSTALTKYGRRPR
jgi:hypothetical protein